MARVGTGITLSRQQYSTIAWLRWRIFVNSMRRKGASAEFVVKVLSYPVLALMILGPGVGAGFAGYYCVSNGMDQYLAIPLWIIFALWQFIGASTSTTGPSFDLSTLVRFPLRYRDYFLILLSFGLLDPPTLAGIACLIAMSIGIGIAAPALFPWAALSLAVYALCNILFSRMLYSWLERWLAQRRTRELITGLILLFSLGFQFASQFAGRFSGSRHHAALSPWMKTAEHVLLIANGLLPPGLTSSAIEHIHGGLPWIAIAAFGGLLLYAAGFLVVLHLRIYAQYRGENLSETSAKRTITTGIRKSRPAEEPQAASVMNAAEYMPVRVRMGLVKELRYLLRSGPKLYVLVMPVFIVLLFSARSSGMNYMGVGRGEFATYLFSYACAYTQLLLVGMLYNSLGSDGAGVQFYFLAPLRMRDVLLAKNLLVGIILVLEIVLTYITAAFLSAPASLSLAAATIAWTLFTFLVNATVGNIRSLNSPKAIDPSKMRGQNISGMSGLISVVITAGCVGLGAVAVLVSKYLQTSYWAAAGVFLLLAGVAFGVYRMMLRQLDEIAKENAENLIAELCKR